MADDVIGRETELAILDRFLDSIPAGPGALLLSGFEKDVERFSRY